MECNKEEAVRARQLAESKMEKNDFEGARKIALKAQNLYPELENVSQLLSVCDIHCAAQKRVFGTEKDWYGIFQIGALSDEQTVKKQYRRLALVLHPDKNRFPGAEAAFKYVLEANSVLSDPTKKKIYDSKLKASTASASVNLPPYHMNQNSQFTKPYGSHNHVYTPFTGFHQHQTPDANFWTSCPFCSMKYQFQRKYINNVLRCQKCSKTFTGYEISGPSGVPLGTAWAAPGVNPSMGQTRVPSHSKFTEAIHNVKGSSSSFHCQRAASRKPVQSKPGVQAQNSFSGVRVERPDNISEGLKSRKMSNNSDANNSRRTNPNNKSRRGRKRMVESSESDDTDTSSDSDVTINPGNDMSSPVHYPRRSTRKRQKVSYNEDDDDDLANNLKSSEGAKLSEDIGVEEDTLENEESENGRANDEETATIHPEESTENQNAEYYKEVKKSEGRGCMSNTNADPIEIESDPEQDPFVNDGLSGDVYDCPDPEFSDFDKNREESCFAVNQIWACYAPHDNMPRFYAKVKKIRRIPFELSITWLEANPIDEACTNWRDAGLPIGCGIFKLGSTEKTSKLTTFSHEVHYVEGRRRGSVVIYPNQGEVWALFKDWELSWSSEPEEHRTYKYEIVEVLSEFNPSQGIKVCRLDKVAGYVCLFEKSARSEASSFVIVPSELYKFSHCVPSCTMNGSEGPGVPIASFELDPASLPLNPDDLYYPSKGLAETESTEPGKSNAPPELAVE